MTPATFYEPSGKANPLGLIGAVIAILIVAFIGGYTYTLISTFSPIVYLNAVLAFFFALGLGFVVRWLCHWTHNRNTYSRIGLAGFAGIVTAYFAWVAFLLFATNDMRMPSFTNLYLDNALMGITSPGEFFGLIKVINQVGMWEVASLPLNGIFLTLIWLVELGLFMLVPIMNVWASELPPYAEESAEWYPKKTLHTDFGATTSPAVLIPKFQENAVQALQELGNGEAWKYVKAHVYYLPSAKDQYLAIERVYIEDRGEGSTETEIIVPYLRIDKATADAILAAYPSA